ncbi:MAG: sigma-70 family RNA polymerase sigma factor [Bacteroidales bacterium]|nr:sigma-70 family RNA polymerase sigma factor [Bacteroidales bacterium]
MLRNKDNSHTEAQKVAPVMQSIHPLWHHNNESDIDWMDMERVIGAALAGDQQAIGKLYNAYSHKVLGICYNVVGNRAVAEELAHDAFVLAFSKLDHLRDPNRFDAWLSSIASNVALRYKQRHHVLATVPVDDMPDETWIADEASDMPTMGEIMAAVNALPNGYGKVFKMAVMQDMSHKEIGEILGIAAHSSSSQLARAKKMLQHSLAKYWAVILLALLTPLALLFLRQPEAIDEQQPKTADADKPTVTTGDNQQATGPVRQQRTGSRNIAITVPDKYERPIASIADTSCVEKSSTQPIDTTTERPNHELPHLKLNGDIHFANVGHRTTIRPKQDGFKRWSADLAYIGQPSPEADRMSPHNFVVPDFLAPSVPGEPDPTRTIENWSDYIAYIEEFGDILSEKTETVHIMKQIAMSNEPFNDGQIVRKTHHSLPLTYSLSLRYQANKRIGLESGLQYTRLNSLFQTGEGANRIDEKQRIDYLGVPLKVSYRIWTGKHVGIYTSAGVTLEIPVKSTVTTDYILNNKSQLRDSHHLDVPLQWSTGVGIGVQYNITPTISIFAEPGVQYYIPDGSGFETYRTQHPFTISIPAGLRFTW